MTKPRKQDRRTLYTQEVIKNALLELLNQRAFNKISVSRLCEQAEITRTTFYSHYNNISEVLDVLIADALEIASEGTQVNTPFPVCQRLTDLPKYRALFLDQTLSGYIIQKIYHYEKPSLVQRLITNTTLSEKEAELLFCFLLNGSFAVNKDLGWEKNDLWNNFQSVLLKFIQGGMDKL